MRLLALAALLGGVCALHALDAQPPAESSKGPVHAKLLKYLSVRRVQAGSPVFVRVTADWTGPNCTLRKGAIVEGKVESAAPREKGRKGSELALSFLRAQCGGEQMSPLDLVLAAVSYVPEDPENGAYPVMRVMRIPTISSGPGAAGNLPLTSAEDADTVFTHSVEFRQMAEAARSRKLNAGEVYGVKGVTMQMGAGPHRSSLLTARNRDIAFDEGTEFLLVPASVAFVPAAATWTSSPAHTAAAAASPEMLKVAPAPPPAPGRAAGQAPRRACVHKWMPTRAPDPSCG